MDENFANMRSLIHVLDQPLYDTIQKNGDFSHFYFCYRYVNLANNFTRIGLRSSSTASLALVLRS
jgi:hypothetical protein